ncbi:MAG: helix-turn-helix domain-containing protein [Lachnospiraceae bacterium]|nr:helix-turn-helix domain-containing protein [Lachnospiraceae bacterium]
MKKIKDLNSALKRIQELEKENSDLKAELEYYKNRKVSGRQKHNAKWMAIYNDFTICHEKGMSIEEIANRNNISERSIYRYKAYYEEMKKNSENNYDK